MAAISEFVIKQFQLLFISYFQPNLYVDAHGTLLQSRHVPFLDRYASNLILCSSHANNLNHSNLKDDSQIIQEIVQKFILIPKSQTVSEVNVEQQKQQQAQPKFATDDINWKSKYDILNQLKENEKEEPTKFIIASNEIPTKDTQELPKTHINESNCYSATHLTLPDVHPLNIQQLPGAEDSLPIQSSYNLQKCDDNRFEDQGDFMIQEQRENIKYDIEDQLKTAGTIEKNESNLDSNVYYNTKMKQVTKGDSSKEFLNINNNNANTDFLQDNGFSSIERKPPIEPVNEFNNPMQQYTEKSEQPESMQYPINVHPEVFIPYEGAVLEDGVNINPNGYEGNEQSESMQCSVDVINSEAIILNDDVVLEDGGNMNYEGHEESEQSQRMQYPIHNSEEFTLTDGVVVEDRVNTNSEGHEGASNYGIVTLSDQSGNIGDTVDPNLGQAEINENAVNANGIEEFEAEQSDMWHESPSENVAYPQEAHEQPNQYYYEQVQDYPVDVNEHEETQLNYDQSYEQQYVNQYEAEYQQETQQYDQSQAYHEGYEQNYETQPVYDGYNEEESNHHQQQMHGTPQSIEQELDNEQGYVEKDIEENKALDTNTPETLSNAGVDPTELR